MKMNEFNKLSGLSALVGEFFLRHVGGGGGEYFDDECDDDPFMLNRVCLFACVRWRFCSRELCKAPFLAWRSKGAATWKSGR